MAYRSVSNVVCSDYFTVCINNGRDIVSFGFSYYRAHGHREKMIFPPKVISSLNCIISISLGSDHCACLDSDGKVFTIGYNFCGQLGIGDEELYKSIPQKVNLPPCTQVSCGYEFTTCLSENGEVYSFGRNDGEQLGLGNNESFCYPQLIESLKDVEFIDCGEYTHF